MKKGAAHSARFNSHGSFVSAPLGNHARGDYLLSAGPDPAPAAPDPDPPPLPACIICSYSSCWDVVIVSSASPVVTVGSVPGPHPTNPRLNVRANNINRFFIKSSKLSGNLDPDDDHRSDSTNPIIPEKLPLNRVREAGSRLDYREIRSG